MRPSRALTLVAACCRWPGGEKRDAAVRAAAVGVDWTRVEALMRRHRVNPLVFAALKEAGVAVPAPILMEMMSEVALAKRLDQTLAREGARLQAALAAEGIAAPIVKGAPLAMLAYGSPAFKQAKDVDLLVRQDRVAAALAILKREGYYLLKPAATLTARQLADVMRYDTEIGLAHRQHAGLQIDLHWRLTRNPHMLVGLDADAPTQLVRLADEQDVRTLQDDDLFAYLCVHGAAHGWFRLKWLADMAAFAAGRDVAALYRAAGARGVSHAAAQALLLAHALLAIELPAPLFAELQQSGRTRRLVRAALDLIAGPGADTEIVQRRFGRLKLQYAEWLLTRDLADARATLQQYLVPVGDVLAVPLPRALHFLYPVLRVPLGIARAVGRRAG